MRIMFVSNNEGLHDLRLVVSQVGGWVSGVLAFILTLLGGWDIPLGVLLGLIACDLALGSLKAAKERNLSSSSMFGGIAKKVSYLVIIAAGFGFDLLVSDYAHIQFTYFHTFFNLMLCVSEFVSVLENASVLGAPIPPVVIKALGKLQEQLDRGELPNLPGATPQG